MDVTPPRPADDAPPRPADDAPPHSADDAPPRAAGPVRALPHPAGPVRALPVVLAAAVVALQIAYPLVPIGPARDRLTVVIVAVFAAASVTHALLWRGPRFAAALVATTTLGGLAVEVVGVHTGWPFGSYRYTGSLGLQVLGVPVVVALAWTMMAYPAYVVSEVIGGGIVRRTLVGGWALAAWDLFLDPQMVREGHWQWQGSAWELAGIPLSNHLAWFAVATVMLAALRAATGLVPAHAATTGRSAGAATAADAATAGALDDRVPLTLYVWTFASSVLAHAVFFGLPMSALTGGVGMGVVVVALLRALRSAPPDRAGRREVRPVARRG